MAEELLLGNPYDEHLRREIEQGFAPTSRPALRNNAGAQYAMDLVRSGRGEQSQQDRGFQAIAAYQEGQKIDLRGAELRFKMSEARYNRENDALSMANTERRMADETEFLRGIVALDVNDPDYRRKLILLKAQHPYALDGKRAPRALAQAEAIYERHLQDQQALAAETNRLRQEEAQRNEQRRLESEAMAGGMTPTSVTINPSGTAQRTFSAPKPRAPRPEPGEMTPQEFVATFDSRWKSTGLELKDFNFIPHDNGDGTYLVGPRDDQGVIDMRKEPKQVDARVYQMAKEEYNRYFGAPGQPDAAPAPAPAPEPAHSAAPVVVNSPEEFESLPSGAVFTFNGRTGRKP